MSRSRLDLVFGGTVLGERGVRNGYPPALLPRTHGKNLEGRPHDWCLSPRVMSRSRLGDKVPVASRRQYSSFTVKSRSRSDQYCPKVLPLVRAVANILSKKKRVFLFCLGVCWGTIVVFLFFVLNGDRGGFLAEVYFLGCSKVLL